MKFTKIPQNTFEGLQVDAGVLLRRFNPANPVEPDDADLICATTGGINPVCQAEFSDYGEDVDNVPNNMMELKHLDGWNCSLSFTSLGTSPELIRMALGCADIDSNEPSRIIPRMSVDLSKDFGDVWWVGDRADGGMVAIRLMNALSTEGFSLQTTKNGKGQVDVTLTGHVSITAQSVVPMEFYSADPTGTTVTYDVVQNLTNVTSDFAGATVEAHKAFTATLAPEAGYTMGAITVMMGGVDVTGTTVSGTAINIPDVTGDITITATATVSVTTFNVVQNLTDVTSDYAAATANENDSIVITLTPDTGLTIDTVSVTMGGTDVTATAWDSATSQITLTVTGDVEITATAQ
jgi:hypothetical protein